MPKILIIDDDSDVRLALTATLEDHGFEVVEGADGSEALGLALTHAPDVIILDVNMPIVDGVAALELLRADVRTSDIPICMLTSVRDTAYRDFVLSLGADDYFMKPWSDGPMTSRLTDLSEHGRGGAGGSARIE